MMSLTLLPTWTQSRTVIMTIRLMIRFVLIDPTLATVGNNTYKLIMSHRNLVYLILHLLQGLMESLAERSK